MDDRKNEENPARTVEYEQEVQPGDERVSRRGSINKHPEVASEDDGERYDAG